MALLRRLLILLLLALIAAKIAAIVAAGPVPIELDAQQYWQLSASVMDGDLLLFSHVIAFRTPGYPWFLALVRVFTGPAALFTVVALQAVMAWLTIAIWAAIAARVTKLPRAAIWTLVVSLPAVSAYTFTAAILSEWLFVFLLSVHLLAVLNYARADTPGRAVWMALTFTAALLTRPIVILLWVPHLLFLFFIHWRRRRRLGKTHPLRLRLMGRFGHLTVAAGTVVILLAPWLVRNKLMFDDFFVTEFLGRNLWIVTFQDGSGAGLALPDTDAGEQLQTRLSNVGADEAENWRHTWHVSNALVRSGLNDAQADRLMQRVAMDAIEPEIAWFSAKTVRRIVNFWRTAATDLPAQSVAGGNYHGQLVWKQRLPGIEWLIEHRWSQSVLLNTIALGAIALSLLILLVNTPTRPYGLWLALILAYFTVVTGVLEIPAYRYRMVVEPMASATVGSAIAVVLSRRRKPAKITAS